MIKAGLLKFVHQITAHAYMRICVALLAGFTAFFAMTVTAYAYIGRTDSPPGTAGSIIPNGQIVGGLPFLIQHTDDATLTSIQDRGDLYKYGPDGIPIRNGTDSLGGIWGFDHVSHNGTPISENNGYKMVGQSTVGTWIAALKGDPSYVASNQWNTTFVDSAGQTFPVANVSQIVEMSGASFVPLLPGQNWFDQPVYATDPPRAQITIVGSQTVQEGTPIKVENHASIEAYHSNYHFELVTVRNAAGQDVTSQAFHESSLQGKAPYNGETLYAPTGAQMVEVNGGGATSYPPTFKETVDGGSGVPNEVNTQYLKPGRYYIHLYVKDWFNRLATVATASFTVTQSPISPPPPPPPPGGGGGGSTCSPPIVPPIPPNQVLSYHWSPDGSGGQWLTWTDTHWQLQTTTDGEGCMQYIWVDEPVTYRHDYPLNLSNLQITGLFYDPGQPGDVWSPTNQSASQQNADAYADGSTIGGGPAQSTFGNPMRNPAVYVRVGGGMAFRLQWTGSPHDMPSRANVTFQMVNPDGEENVWSQSFGLLPSTIFNAGDVPVWDPVGYGYPLPATEYGWAYASIPKYATTGVPNSFSQLTAWNLTGDSASAAHMKATVTFTIGTGSSVTWTNTGLARTLGYPTWYFLHQIPNTAASYSQPQPTWSLLYTAKSFSKIGSPGLPLPRDTVSGP